MVTDAAQAVVWNDVIDPYGTTLPIGVDTIALDLRYPGQWLQAETGGLAQNWFRDYDASVARYGQADRVGLVGGPNLYAYVFGDPTRYLDPTGLGLAFGVFGNASATVGLGSVPPNPEMNLAGAASASAGGGWFLNFDGQPWYAPVITTGGFASFGAMANAGGHHATNPEVKCAPTALGLFGAAGPGFFLSNADSAPDLENAFDTYSFDLVAFSIQFGYSNGTWIVSVTGGVPSVLPPSVGAISEYPTNTWSTAPILDYRVFISGGGW